MNDLVSTICDKRFPTLKRVGNFFSALYHFFRWSWVFGRFGFRSRLAKPDMLTLPKGIHIGNKVLIRKGSRLEAIGPLGDNTAKLTIGNNTSIQFYFHCGAAESVKIGNDVLIATRVYITDHDHVFDDPDKPARWCGDILRTKPVIIEDGVWLGEGAVVLKGVTIGKRAVIGANAVVTHDIPPFSIAVGNPARVIRKFLAGCQSKQQ